MNKNETDRLRAENASLREALRHRAEAATERIIAAEQRAEAAEKERLYRTGEAAEYARKLAAAEQRNTELERALRRIAETPDMVVLNDGARAGDMFQQIARAALHDKERSAPPEEG